MIKEMKLIPTTAESYPFISANFHCDLVSRGYVEDEYFMTGTANVYDEGERFSPKVIFEDAPYTTRVLVRRPVDPAKFSGNVVVEILNATAMMDIDRMWIDSWKYYTRNGDVYVGISSKGHVVDAMKAFDPKRYEAINWANPTPEHPVPEKASPFDYLPQYELGLFWDMLVDLAKLLRTEDALNPLKGWGKRWVYLTGWSQSGGYINRIVKSFAYLPENTENGPLFDGYLSAGSGVGLAPMNSYCARQPIFSDSSSGIPAPSVMGAKEPYIAINTESENCMTNWLGDFDQPNYKFRTYQIPGSSHDSKYNLVDYYAETLIDDLKRVERPLQFEGVEGEPLDNPYEIVFNAITRNLYAWVREGVPAPHAPKIEVEILDQPDPEDPYGYYLRNQTDAFGNAIGGIRTPGLDYPVGRYWHSTRNAEGGFQTMFGHVKPFSAEKLTALYGSLAHYRELVTAQTEKMIALGFLLPEDQEDMIEITVGLAAKRGLC